MLWTLILFYAVLTCSVLSVLVGGLLWQKKQPEAYAQRLLSIWLLLYGYVGFISSLILNGTIVEVPHFFRTAAPLYYVAGPLVYLYVRASLLTETRFNWRRSWLFLPALLNFIELIPFYGQSAAYKVACLMKLPFTTNSLTVVDEGLTPAFFHPVGYTLSGLIYALLAAKLLRDYLRVNEKKPSGHSVFQAWIKTFVLIHLTANGLWTLNMLFLRNTPYANYTINLIFVVAHLLICVYIIQRPSLLYGANWLRKPVRDPDGISEQAASTMPTTDPIGRTTPDAVRQDGASLANNHRKVGITTPSEPDAREKLLMLEQYMTSQKPYLQPRLSLADVSVATSIPPYLLSAVLNGVLGIDFRDYVNEQRVRHLCTLLQRGDYSHLTLEGIGMEAGFSSKTTFYRAFQKHTGLTPHQYAMQKGPEGRAPVRSL